MVLDLQIIIKSPPKRIKRHASQIELDDDWREIEGFPHYRINRHGQVKRLDAVIIDSRGISYRRKGRILNNRKTPGGYVQVDMSEDGVIHGRFVHVLLAKAFIPNPDNLPIVNHKDENPSNYDLSNLEWCDYSYNAKYSMDKIRKGHIKEMKAVIRINPETGEETEYEGIRVAERENNITHAGIRYAIIHNNICKGYKWKYKDEKYNNVKPKVKLDIWVPPIIIQQISNMNLNAYDNIKEELDKHKTWYSPKFRRLYSREIKFRPFYKFMKRWNETIKRNDYFLAISMNNVDGKFSIANRDNYSRTKFSIPKEVIEDSILNSIVEDTNIEVKLVDNQVDGEVYQLNI